MAEPRGAQHMNKRALRIGPATTLALGIGIVVAYLQWPRWQDELQQDRSIGSLRQQFAQRGGSRTPLPHNLDTIWHERTNLKLSASQLGAVGRLRNAEAQEAAPVRHHVEEERRAFGVWMEAHQSGAPLNEIQARAANYSVASATWTRVRLGYWRQGLDVLNPKQRAALASKTEGNP